MKKLGWLLFGLLAAYFIFLIRQDIIDQIELKRDEARLARAVVAEESKAGELTDRLSRLKGDDLIEELARTRLGLIKQGETAYKVVK